MTELLSPSLLNLNYKLSFIMVMSSRLNYYYKQVQVHEYACYLTRS